MTKKLIKLFFVSLILTTFLINYSLGNVNGSYVNVSYSNVDQRMIDDLRIKEWTPVRVILYNDKNFVYTSDIKRNREIYKNKAEYYDEIKDTVLLTLNEREFMLGSKFHGLSGFAGDITIEGLEKLANNPKVKEIKSDYSKMQLFLEDSVPLINADKVWQFILNDENITGLGQIVCVIDSGVNASHPDLSSNVLAQKCFCDNSTQGDEGCCPNGLNEDDSALDYHGHGTHVSGIVVANGSPKGVAYRSNIVVVRITNDVGDIQQYQDIIDAIDWCINYSENNNTISAITMSFGEGLNDTYCDSSKPLLSSRVDDAVAHDIFVVAAAGNDGNATHIALPACIENVVSVGATYDESGKYVEWDEIKCIEWTQFDQIGCGSNRASILNLFAPGSLINSTFKGYYTTRTGTSHAAPHVAGVAALMKQANNSLTPADIMNIMVRTGKLVYDPDSGYNSTYPGSGLTFPRVDAYRAVMASMHDLVVSDTEILYPDEKYRLFSFKVFNNLNQSVNNINWNVDFGDGNSTNSDQGITLDAFEDVWVYVEYEYGGAGNYTVNVTANSTSDFSNWQSIQVQIEKDFSISNLTSLCQDCSGRRVFNFSITNHYISSNFYWNISLGDGNDDSSDYITNLAQDEDVWVYVEHTYESTDSYTVNATATSGDLTKYTSNLIANITQV